MPDFPQIIPTPAQMEALSASLQQVGGGAASVPDESALLWMNRFVDTEIAARADILALLVYCSFHPAERGPSIGRKRRARRARGRERADV